MVEERRAAFPHFPELASPRLRLREIRLEDAAWYLEHFSRPEIVAGQGYLPPAGLDAAREELRRYVVDLFARRQGFRWGLELRDRPGLVGSIGLYAWLDEPVRQAELGYDIDPAWWGRGLMGEALAAVLAFAFGPMRLERVEAYVMTRNERSARLLERAGFAREALLRAHGTDEHGAVVDEWLFARGRPGT